MNNQNTFTRYLLPHEERTLVQTVKHVADVYAQRDHAWMRLLRQTGIRVGTLAGLTVEHAHYALRTGYLSYEAEIAKRKKPGRVYANKKALQALRDLLKVRRVMGYPEVPAAPLIMSRHHKAMAIRSFQARMQLWVRAANLPVNASPHWWRHTLGKRLIDRSTSVEPLRIVQAALNHANIQNTAIYTQPGREEIERSMEEAS